MIKSVVKVLVNGQFRWVKESAPTNAVVTASSSEVRRVSPKTGILIAKS